MVKSYAQRYLRRSIFEIIFTVPLSLLRNLAVANHLSIMNTIRIPRSLSLLLISVANAILHSCYYDNEQNLYGVPAPCDTFNVSYTAEIKGIINENCKNCHNNTSASGNLNLESDLSRVHNIDSIISRISLPAGNPKVMPTSGPMPSCNIQKIKAWRNQGLSITN